MIKVYNYLQKKRAKKSNNPFSYHGFTLVESLIVVFVLGIVMGGLFLTFNVGQASFPATSARLEAQSEARNAMNWIMKDLRQAINYKIAENNATSDYLRINLWEWNNSTYQWDINNNVYVEYFYNDTTRKLTRKYTNALGGISTLEFNDIVEAPFYTNYTTKTYAEGIHNKIIVAVSVEKTLRGGLSVPFTLISEVKIRNGG